MPLTPAALVPVLILRAFFPRLLTRVYFQGRVGHTDLDGPTKEVEIQPQGWGKAWMDPGLKDFQATSGDGRVCRTLPSAFWKQGYLSSVGR